MTRKYTAADFENAKFAEHPETDALAVKRATGPYEWTTFDDDGYTGWLTTATMLKVDGWVPVPTKPQITESRFTELVDVCSFAFSPASYREFCRLAGIEIIPDPEPADEELLAGIIRGIDDWQSITSPELLAKYLNTAGVTPPKEDK